MASASFARHCRLRLDVATSRALLSLPEPGARAVFERLLELARRRSSLMRTPPAQGGRTLQIEALVNLARFHREFLREPESWPGASGHPLPVVEALARHLLGRHPTPRFLASAWFGGEEPRELERRRWFVAHSAGQRFRSLPLPMLLTRRMERLFLGTPDHYPVDHALRRAELLALGGSAGLVTRVLSTRLGRAFDHPDFWRRTLEWLAHREADLDLAQVGPIIDYLHTVRHATSLVDTPEGEVMRGPPRPDFELHGRTVASLLREVSAWHLALGTSSTRARWAPSRFHGMVQEVGPPDEEGVRVEWVLVELLDSAQLAYEGRAMRHCVSTYAPRCAWGSAAIWSLRRRHGADGPSKSVLTIEVDPRSSMIVQLRGPANRRASGIPLQLVKGWAARERLGISGAVQSDLAGPGP